MGDLLLLWHMHQPRYAHPADGVAMLPWVRLHACSGYLDMARMLERHPRARVTVNFVPSLVEQIEQIVEGGRDALERLTERPVATLDPGERAQILARCFSVHPSAVADRPRFVELASKRRDGFDDDELRDLACLFLLGWIGFAVREDEPRVAALDAKGRGYTEADKSELHAIVRRAVGRVLPSWRALAARGQIELVASPFHHPIVPLLVDSDVARVARPDMDLPVRFRAPEHARLHIDRARAAHERWSGSSPRGMWPPEGSLSHEAVEVYRDAGIAWLLGDEETLARSLGEELPPAANTRVWEHAGVRLLFRDRDLSDRIGFRYAHMSAESAVEDLFHTASERLGGSDGVVCVFLDGENAWEHYAGRGEPFLEALYSRMESEAQSGNIRSRTISECIDARGSEGTIARLHAGSWIAGDFRIWIGDPAKNRAWTLLRHAVDVLRHATAIEGEASPRVIAARECLLAAEASDWFWWFGEPNHSAEDVLYDALFRSYLREAYRSLGQAVPEALDVPIDPRADAPMGASPAMRPGGG